MDTFGQYGPISITPNKEISGIFTVNKMNSLNKPNEPCEPDEKYSFNACLWSYVTRITNCSINALSNKFNCTSEGLLKMYHTLNDIKFATKWNISKNTGCLPKCTTNTYMFHLDLDEDVTWRKDWISSFYLSSMTTTYPTIAEYFSYDEQVLFSYYFLVLFFSLCR